MTAGHPTARPTRGRETGPERHRPEPIVLAPESVEAVARRVADLAERPAPAAMNLSTAAGYLGVSLDFLHEHVLGELRVVRRGRKRLIPVAELDRWLDANAERTIEAKR